MIEDTRLILALQFIDYHLVWALHGRPVIGLLSGKRGFDSQGFVLSCGQLPCNAGFHLLFGHFRSHGVTNNAPGLILHLFIFDKSLVAACAISICKLFVMAAYTTCRCAFLSGRNLLCMHCCIKCYKTTLGRALNRMACSTGHRITCMMTYNTILACFSHPFFMNEMVESYWRRSLGI